MLQRMDAERNLDALIFELDQSPSSNQEEGSADGAVVDEDNLEAERNLDALILELDRDQDDGVVREDNLEVARPADQRRPANKYLSSSSAKRRMIKQTDCHFCPADLNRDTIEEHLKTSQDCLTLYLRKLHLKTLDAVILKIYPCLYCEVPFHKLSIHLQTQPECLRQFKEKFNVTSLSAVIKKISNLKKQEYKSRRSLERQFETAKAKSKKKAKLSSATPEDYLNKHLQQTAFSNYKKCCNCLCNLISAEEVFETTDIVQNHYDIEVFSHHRRANKYFLCNFCRVKKECVPEIANSCFSMTGVEADNKIVFVPGFAPISAESDEIGLQPLLQSYGKDIKVMFPAAVSSIQSFQNNIPSKKLNSFEVQNLLYGNQIINNELLANIYHHQLSKYLSLEKFGDLFTGQVEDYENKIVSNLEHCNGLENNIRASFKSDFNRRNEVHRKIAQFGNFCLFLSTEVPVDHQTVATNLLQRGFVVTTSYSGKESQEMDRIYFVHRGHSANSECNENNCQKITLENYLLTNTDIQLTNENVSTYICSVENFQNSFIANIINSPVAPLAAQEYHFTTKFNEKGIARLEGIIWPTSFQKMNLLKLDENLCIEESEAIKRDYLEKIKSSIAATSDPEVLKRQFSLSEVDCETILRFISKHQTHYCGECVSCRDPPLPSLQIMLCVTPDDEHIDNIPVSMRFSKIFKSRLMSLGQDVVENSTSFHWLESVLDEFDSETIEPNMWKINHGEAEFLFKVDTRLADLMEDYDYCILLAAYQYSISCVNHIDENKVIFDRPHISDCYLKPFNPFILKGAVGTTNLQVLNSTEDYNNQVWCPPTVPVRCDAPLIDHKEVSLTEALVLLDSNKLNIKTSSGIVYVYTGPNWEQKNFKKRAQPKGNCFTQANQPANDFYECLETMVTRFLRRMNGKDLLLCEMATGYEYVGADKSQELYDVYRSKIHKIEDNVEQCITSGAFYPEMILCDFGDFGHVLKKRKKGMQVLNFPKFDRDSFEFKHSQVLLYTNVQSSDDLTREAVEASFASLTDDGERVIDRNRKMFLIKARKLNN